MAASFVKFYPNENCVDFNPFWDASPLRCANLTSRMRCSLVGPFLESRA